MPFGNQSGPPATPKQVQYLLALVQKAGHAGFRDARHPLGLTQRQAGGKFSRSEASELIDRLVAGEIGGEAPAGEAVSEQRSLDERSASDRLDAERAAFVRGVPAELLAAELERRGWSVAPPDHPA